MAISGPSALNFLEENLERLSSLPQDVRRCMELIKELDKQWKTKLSDLKAAQRTYLEHVRQKSTVSAACGAGVAGGMACTLCPGKLATAEAHLARCPCAITLSLSLLVVFMSLCRAYHVMVALIYVKQPLTQQQWKPS